ncbi:MAG: hypothetical protein ACYTHM_08150 [Planctomycetota bacterium]|jgi:hypothetical protein
MPKKTIAALAFLPCLLLVWGACDPPPGDRVLTDAMPDEGEEAAPAETRPSLPPPKAGASEEEKIQWETLRTLEEIRSEMQNLRSDLNEMTATLRQIEQNLGQGRVSVVIKNPAIPVASIKAFFRGKITKERDRYKKRLEDPVQVPGRWKSPEDYIQRVRDRARSSAERYEKMLQEIEPIQTREEMDAFIDKWSLGRWKKELLEQWKDR